MASHLLDSRTVFFIDFTTGSATELVHGIVPTVQKGSLSFRNGGAYFDDTVLSYSTAGLDELDFGTADDFTIEFVATFENSGHILSNDAGTDLGSLYIGRVGTSMELWVKALIGGQLKYSSVSGTSPHTTDVHVAFVRRRGEFRLYVNGEYEATHEDPAIDIDLTLRGLVLVGQMRPESIPFKGQIKYIRVSSAPRWYYDYYVGFDYQSPLVDTMSLFLVDYSKSMAEVRSGYPYVNHGTYYTQTAPILFNSTGVSYNISRTMQWRSVACGLNHTVAVTSDFRLFTWGSNSHGQLGVEGIEGSDIPIQIGIGKSWRSAHAGDNFSFAIDDKSKLFAWGANEEGQLGIGSQTNTAPISQVGTDSWSTVSGGRAHAVGLRGTSENGRTIYTWGSNSHGQLGRGASPSITSSPVRIGAYNEYWRYVSAAGDTSFGIRLDGTLYGWGNNSNGQLGQSDTNSRNTPTQVGTATTWRSVSTGGPSDAGFTLAINTNNELWGWGNCTYGQLGLGIFATQVTGAWKVGSLANWADVQAGAYSTLALTTSGTLYVCGRNNKGQLARSSTSSLATLTSTGDATWSAIAISNSSSFGIAADESLLAWGDNTYGQLGLGPLNPGDRYTPLPVKSRGPLDLGSSAFTIDTMIYPGIVDEDAPPRNGPAVSVGQVIGSSRGSLAIEYTTNNQLVVTSDYAANSDPVSTVVGSATEPGITPYGKPKHIALVRETGSDTVTIFVDGRIAGTVQTSIILDMQQANEIIEVGYTDIRGGDRHFTGGMYWLRISDWAIWTDEFTPITYGRQRKKLTVIITGADGLWSVGGPTSYESGQSVYLLVGETYTLSFSEVEGMAEPDEQQIVASTVDDLTVTGVYRSDYGWISVSSNAEAAEWFIEGSTERHALLTPLIVDIGQYTINFTDILGWNTPASQLVTVQKLATTNVSATYTRQHGALRVDIVGLESGEIGVWSILDNPGLASGLASGTVISNLPVDEYYITFSYPTHYLNPGPQSCIIEPGTSEENPTVFTYTVTRNALIIITLSGVPDGVGVPGWRLVSDEEGEYWLSGEHHYVESGDIGIEFRPIPGYIAPSAFALTAVDGETYTYDLAYSQDQGWIRINLANVSPGEGGWYAVPEEGEEPVIHASGELVPLLSGEHTIRYVDIPGKITPANVVVTLSLDDTEENPRTLQAIYGTVTFRLKVSLTSPYPLDARWYLDGGSVAYVNNYTTAAIPAGVHTVSFKDVPYYQSPTTVVFSHYTADMYVVNATYTASVGYIKVTLTGPLAARWSIDGGGTWVTSGSTVSVTAGSVNITFLDVADWYTPNPVTIDIAHQETVVLSYAYEPYAGRILVVTEGYDGEWSIDNGVTWRAPGESFAAEEGTYFIIFKEVEGYYTPAGQTVTVDIATTTSVVVRYIEKLGSITVDIVDAVGYWSVNRLTWISPGATLVNVGAGTYTLYFSEVKGRLTPTPVTVVLTQGEVKYLGGIQYLVDPYEPPPPESGEDEWDPFDDDGYTSIPEVLALWTIEEPYYPQMLTQSTDSLQVWHTYDRFNSSPYSGNLCALYWLMDSVWDVTNWAGNKIVWDNSKYINSGNTCVRVGYDRGFRRAPIPIIPYMVDTFSPPPQIVIPPSLRMSQVIQYINSCRFIRRIRIGGTSICLEAKEPKKAEDRQFWDEIDEIEQELILDPKCILEDLLETAGGPLQVLATDGSVFLWLDVKSCTED